MSGPRGSTDGAGSPSQEGGSAPSSYPGGRGGPPRVNDDDARRAEPWPDGPPSHAALILTYLKISLLGFGGPNAHLALMLDEVVERRRWLSRERFVELIAVTNLLPGPNSSEVAIHVGYTQRGWTGALATGLTFLLPTFVMVTALSALYFRYGTLPQVAPVFWGLQPVIVAVVLHAGVKIGRAGVKTGVQGLLAVGGAAVSLVSGQGVVAAMLAGGAATWWLRRGERTAPDPSDRPDPPSRRSTSGVWFLAPVAAAGGWAGSLATVFLTHLIMGSVLFGGGYVLVALLEPYAVDRYGWLTSAQFLDGVALTQAVPGPISTLSAFVGYAAAGVPGAVLGTVGIYLPAFVAVLFVAPRLERWRRVDALRHALEGVVPVAAGAVFGVGVMLARAGIVDAVGALVALVALALAWRKVATVWLVAGGLVLGVARAVWLS
ncbi:MAG: chromate efflux transporter [Longimicrobiales bacterium]